MSERHQGPYDSIARRWLALVERRQAHFVELCDTGRWRHYYTQAEFLDEMRKVLRVREQWATIAGLPVAEDAPPPPTDGGEARAWALSAAVPSPAWPG